MMISQITSDTSVSIAFLVVLFSMGSSLLSSIITVKISQKFHAEKLKDLETRVYSDLATYKSEIATKFKEVDCDVKDINGNVTKILEAVASAKTSIEFLVNKTK